MPDIHDIKVRYVLDDSQLKSGQDSVHNLVKTQDTLTSSVAKTGVESDKTNQKIQKDAAESARQISQANNQINQSAKNFGGLKSAVSGVTGEIKNAAAGINIYGINAGSAFSILDSGLKTGVAGFRGLEIAIASTGIGLLVVAFGSLVAYFEKTELGSEKLGRAFAGLGAAVSVIIGKAAELGSLIVKAFESPGKAVSKLGDLIQDLVSERIAILLGGIKGIGTAFLSLTSGEFAQAAKQAGQAFLDINRSINPIAISAEKVAGAYKSIGKEALAAAKIAMEFTGVLQDIEDDENNLALSVAKTRNQIQLLIIKSRDRALTEKQRIDALVQADKLEQGIINSQIALQKKKVEALQKDNDLRVANKELDKDEVTGIANKTQALRDAEIELENLLGNSLELRGKLQDRENAIEIQGAKKKKKTLEDLNKAILDDVNSNAEREEFRNIEKDEKIVISAKDAAELKRQVDEGYSKDLSALEEDNLQAQLDKYDKDKAAALQKEKEKQAALQQIKQQGAQIAVSIANSLFQVNKNNLQAELDQTTLKYNQQIKLAGDNVQLQSQINAKYNADQAAIKRKQAQADKNSALFTIAINTASAIVKAAPNPYLIALAAATGLAEAVAVESRPIPQFNKGTKYVPGRDIGNRDTVLSMLTPGEAVVPRDKNQAYKGIIGGIIDGTLDPRFNRLAEMDYSRIEQAITPKILVNDNSAVLKELQAIKKGFSNITQTHLELSERGFRKWQQRGSNETEFVNDYFKN